MLKSMVKRSGRLWFEMALAATFCLAIPDKLQAQSGTRTIMRGNPDGTHEVLMLTAPDYFALRTPDFSARDLEIMKSKLVLSDEQEAEFRRRIEQYLLEFRALTKELADATAPEAEFIPDEEKKAMAREFEADEGPPRMNLNGIDLPEGVSVGFGTAINRPSSNDPNAPALLPNVEISVTLDSPEGDEVPHEVIEKIRARANAVAARLAEHLAAEDAARQAGMKVEQPFFEADDDFEVVKAKQDELLRTVDEFLKAKAALRSQFVADAQTSLAAQQVERWPALERALYRNRSLPKGRLPGEMLDLVQLLENWQMTEQQRRRLASAIEGLEIILDDALRQRDALLATVQQDIDQAIANRKPDLALTLTDRLTLKRLAVRNINRTHIDQFANGWVPSSVDQPAATETGLGEEFRLQALKLCYPQVYARTRGMKMFAALKEMAGLDEELRQDLAEMEVAYSAELAAINEQLRATIDRERAAADRRGIEHLKASMEGGVADDKDRGESVRDMLIKRAELDDRYIEAVSQIIGVERAAGLPKTRTNRDPIRIKSGPETE